jgi:hypothetical protein
VRAVTWCARRGSKGPPSAGIRRAGRGLSGQSLP